MDCGCRMRSSGAGQPSEARQPKAARASTIGVSTSPVQTALSTKFFAEPLLHGLIPLRWRAAASATGPTTSQCPVCFLLVSCLRRKGFERSREPHREQPRVSLRQTLSLTERIRCHSLRADASLTEARRIPRRGIRVRSEPLFESSIRDLVPYFYFADFAYFA